MKEFNLTQYQDQSPLKRNNLNNSNNQPSISSKNVFEGLGKNQNVQQIERNLSGHRSPQDNS